MRIFLWIIGCIFLINTTLHAQSITVCFAFTKGNSKQPAASASFVLENRTTGKQLNLQTRENGELVVEDLKPGRYTIQLPINKQFSSLDLPADGPKRYRITMPYYDATWQQQAKPVFDVHLRLVDKDGAPFIGQETVVLRNNCGDQVHRATTNKEGWTVLPLVANCTYVLSFPDAPNYYKFQVPPQPYAYWEERIFLERNPAKPLQPSMQQALFNCVFEDLEGNKVGGERFWLENIKTKERYPATTNAYGIAQILVPLGESYTISTPHNPAFATREAILAPDQDLLIQTIVYQDLTEAQWRARKAEQAAAAARRDSIAQAEQQRALAQLQEIRDAKAEQRWVEDVVRDHEPLPIKRTLRIRKAVRAKVTDYQTQVTNRPKYAEEMRHPILAVFERNRHWKGKVVVTDVTQSMEPYLDEVLMWHLLNAQQGEAVQHLFFNDGDRRPEADKAIGQTKGFYTCQSKALDSVLACMATAVAAGDGGAPPENDLEALLYGVQYHAAGKEFILIADSHSPIRDIELLGQLNVPVRIILCGAEARNRRYRHLKPDVNEQYLDLARRTGGSIHTLHQDLLHLGQLPEGEQVQVGRFWYLLRHGHFIKLR